MTFAETTSSTVYDAGLRLESLRLREKCGECIDATRYTRGCIDGLSIAVE